MDATEAGDARDAESEFIVVQAPPGAGPSQGGTGEMIIFRTARPAPTPPNDAPEEP